MPDVVGIDSAAIVASRLKEARLAAGLSTRSVAAEIAKKHGSVLSHSAIAKYENSDGRSSPPLRVLVMLAEVYERPVQWLLQKSRPLTGIRYRDTSSRVLVKERHQFEMQAQHWLEAYLALERRVDQRLIPTRNARKYRLDDPIELANSIRRDWEYKDRDPILSVVSILEDFGIRVIELSSQFRIDGLTANFGDELAVVLNPSNAHDRCRMNAAHELFHALSGDCDKAGKTTRAMENRAYEFACNLLIPQSELVRAFEGKSAVRLVQAKERFGISMAAMIYRAEKLRIIDERTAKKLWIQFAKRGWRANEPGSVRPDRAIRFEMLLEKAIAEKTIQWSEAIAIMGVTREAVVERMKLAITFAGQIKDSLEQSDDRQDEQWNGGIPTLKIRKVE